MRELEFGPWAMVVSTVGVVALWAWLPAVPVVLFGLTVLVLIHEGGHLVAARRTGMHATEFFAGFGPVVVAWRAPSGLRVGLKAIPAGGYVKLIGMTAKEQVDPALESGTFRSATRFSRLVVVAAGPAVNLVLGLLLLVLAAGVDPFTHQDPGALSAVKTGWNATASITTGTIDGVATLVTDLDGYVSTMRDPGDRADEAPTRFLSPIGVAQISEEVAGMGPWTIVRLIAIVSIGLGVMNLLPFPPLDGGHAAIVGIEWLASTVTRRPGLRLDIASPGIAMVTAATLVFVLGLGASAVVLDIASPFTL